MNKKQLELKIKEAKARSRATLVQCDDRNNVLREYVSSCGVIKFANQYGLVLGRKEHWRMTKPYNGEIQGIPTSRGVLKITNGIDCYIEQPDGRVFFGHVMNFKPDEIDSKDWEALVKFPAREKVKSKEAMLRETLANEY